MILQSERRTEEITTTAGHGKRAAVRLEFKAMELPRGARLADLVAGHEPVPEAPQADPSDAFERQAQIEQQRFAAELETAHSTGRMEGREEANIEHERRIAMERMQVASLVKEFQRERDRYFAAIEAEVVKLSLAIAARVLLREVKFDPMLLQAVVKVALEKVIDESGTVLRVPEEDAMAWSEVMQAKEAGKVEVRGDLRMERGECVLETSVGRVELGVRAQLEEIEKGFFDLLQQRPA